MNIEQLMRELLDREGGFVNDPDDPGGATNYGITIDTLSNYRGRSVSIAEVRDLTREEAVKIYQTRYLTQPRIDQLPVELMPTVFDMYVNAGNNAIRLLQKTLNKFGADLSVDAVLGPLTIDAAHKFHRLADDYLVDAYGIERRNYYYALADRRQKSRKYARTRNGAKGGWIKRAEEFISARFHLSDASHRMRIANWEG